MVEGLGFLAFRIEVAGLRLKVEGSRSLYLRFRVLTQSLGAS